MGGTSELEYYDDCPRVRAILDMYGAGSLNATEVLGQPGFPIRRLLRRRLLQWRLPW